MGHFSGEKTRGDSYLYAEIVHIISIADSSPRPLSSELFAPAVPALAARQPKAARVRKGQKRKAACR